MIKLIKMKKLPIKINNNYKIRKNSIKISEEVSINLQIKTK